MKIEMIEIKGLRVRWVGAINKGIDKIKDTLSKPANPEKHSTGKLPLQAWASHQITDRRKTRIGHQIMRPMYFQGRSRRTSAHT